MILTETLFRKMSSLALLKETQSHSELMTQASAVLKLAHKRGVELEYILEVRISVVCSVFPLWSATKVLYNVGFLCLDRIDEDQSLLSYTQSSDRLHAVYLSLVTFRWHKLCFSKSKDLLGFSWLRRAWQFHPCLLIKSWAWHRDGVFFTGSLEICTVMSVLSQPHSCRISDQKPSIKNYRQADSPKTWIIFSCRPGCIWMKITRNSPDSWSLLKETSLLLVWWKRRKTDLQIGLHFFRLVLRRHSRQIKGVKGISDSHLVQPPTWNTTVTMGWISNSFGNLKRWRSHSWPGNQLQSCITA